MQDLLQLLLDDESSMCEVKLERARTEVERCRQGSRNCAQELSLVRKKRIAIFQDLARMQKCQWSPLPSKPITRGEHVMTPDSRAMAALRSQPVVESGVYNSVMLSLLSALRDEESKSIVSPPDRQDAPSNLSRKANGPLAHGIDHATAPQPEGPTCDVVESLEAQLGQLQSQLNRCRSRAEAEVARAQVFHVCLFILT